jgi:hypothetical protein
MAVKEISSHGYWIAMAALNRKAWMSNYRKLLSRVKSSEKCKKDSKLL